MNYFIRSQEVHLALLDSKEFIKYIIEYPNNKVLFQNDIDEVEEPYWIFPAEWHPLCNCTVFLEEDLVKLKDEYRKKSTLEFHKDVDSLLV